MAVNHLVVGSIPTWGDISLSIYKMGCSQVVRHRNLDPTFKGSNPFIPDHSWLILINLIKDRIFFSNDKEIQSVFNLLL
jgi:hypothetical protein